MPDAIDLTNVRLLKSEPYVWCIELSVRALSRKLNTSFVLRRTLPDIFWRKPSSGDEI
jgi:hypothetical protein